MSIKVFFWNMQYYARCDLVDGNEGQTTDLTWTRPQFGSAH